MKKTTILIAFAVLLCSCEIPFDIKDISDPRFMIECIPVPGDESFALKVSYADPAFGAKRKETYSFKGDDISVSVNGKTLNTKALEWTQEGSSTTASLRLGLIPGDKVEISVSGNSVPTASASTVIPEIPKISSIDIGKSSDKENAEGRRFVLKLANPVETGEYFGIKISVIEELYLATIDTTSIIPSIKVDTTYYTYSTTAGQVATMSDINNMDLDAFAQVNYEYGGLVNSNIFNYSPVSLLTDRQFDKDSYSFYVNAGGDLFDFDIPIPDFDDTEDQEDPGIVQDKPDESEIPEEPEWPEEPEEPEEPVVPSICIGSKTYYTIALYKFSDELYNYCKAQYLQNFNILSNFGVTPPNFTYSNVFHGLGIVGGLSLSQIEKIPDPFNTEPKIPSLFEFLQLLQQQ